MKLLLLLATVSLCHGDQLSKLLGYLQGGPNPAQGLAGAGISRGGPAASGQGRSHVVPAIGRVGAGRPAAVAATQSVASQRVGAGRPAQSVVSQRRGSVNVISPVPFSEPADPTRGTVQLDVPQPKPTQGIGAQTAVEVQRASSPPPFPGLPAGARQVGGRPVQLTQRKRNRPVPLSQVDAPVFLSETFRSPLNDVDPLRSPVPDPVEALTHNVLPGTRPRARPVQSQNIPVISVLNEDKLQTNFQQNRQNYDNLVQQVFTPNQVEGQRYSDPNQQDLGRVQADLTHIEALERHRQAVEKVERQQQEFQLQQFQQQHLPRQQLPQLHQPHQQPLPQQHQPRQQPLPQQHQPQQFQHQHRLQNPLQQPQQKTHFSIPGSETLRQYEQELRLAQEALRSLGK